MALWIIGILAILVIVATCLPVTTKYYSRYLVKLRYWNILIIFLIYVLFDVWFLTIWWIFILINISGITAIYRTYKEIKNINKK